MAPSSIWLSRREVGGRSRREKPPLRFHPLPFCLSWPPPSPQTQGTLPCTFVFLLLSLEIHIVKQSFLLPLPPHIDKRAFYATLLPSGVQNSFVFRS